MNKPRLHIEHILKEAIRAAGGIVHSDGNIFFTNIEQLREVCAAVPLTDDVELLRNALYEAREALAKPAVPVGYMLVPVEPTLEMCRALFCNLARADDEAYVIKAVMAAAPESTP